MTYSEHLKKMYHAINIFFAKNLWRAPQSCYSAILYFSENVPIQVYTEHWRCLSFYVMMPIWPYAFYLDSIELRFSSIEYHNISERICQGDSIFGKISITEFYPSSDSTNYDFSSVFHSKLSLSICKILDTFYMPLLRYNLLLKAKGWQFHIWIANQNQQTSDAMQAQSINLERVCFFCNQCGASSI